MQAPVPLTVRTAADISSSSTLCFRMLGQLHQQTKGKILKEQVQACLNCWRLAEKPSHTDALPPICQWKSAAARVARGTMLQVHRHSLSRTDQ